MKPTDQQIRRAAKAIRDNISKDLFGSRQPYIPFVETGTMAPSFRPFRPFRHIGLPLKIITNDYITEEKRRSRQKQEGFWSRQWRLLWDHNPWPYSLIEYYTTNEPAMIFDRPNNTIICHPAIEQEIKRRFVQR